MWLKIAKIDIAGRTKKSIGGADSHYIYIYRLTPEDQRPGQVNFFKNPSNQVNTIDFVGF